MFPDVYFILLFLVSIPTTLTNNGVFALYEQATSIYSGDWWLCDERVTLLPEPWISAYLFWK